MDLAGLEVRAIVRLQDVGARGPLPAVANGLSTLGEHAAGWLTLSAVGAAIDRSRRRQWIGVGVAAFVAHAGAVVIKRVVRRTRPDGPGVRVLDATPSRLSFPSAHTASTTAASVALRPLVGPVAAVVPVVMGTGRVLLGVHYPTDVLAGAALGAAVAVVVRRWTGSAR